MPGRDSGAGSGPRRPAAQVVAPEFDRHLPRGAVEGAVPAAVAQPVERADEDQVARRRRSPSRRGSAGRSRSGSTPSRPRATETARRNAGTTSGSGRMRGALGGRGCARDLADEQLPVAPDRGERRVGEDVQVLQVDDVGLEPATCSSTSASPVELDAVLSGPGLLQRRAVDDDLVRGDAEPCARLCEYASAVAKYVSISARHCSSYGRVGQSRVPRVVAPTRNAP